MLILFKRFIISALGCNVSGMPGIAGTAYDNITDPANPGLFCFQQTGSSNLEITKFDINSQTFSGVLHVATDIPGPSGGSSNAVASGMNSFINNDGKLVLLGMVDHFPGNEMIFEYEISNAFVYTNDISVQSLISPASGDDLSASEDVRVKLLNNGTTAQSGFDIQYTIDDGTGALGPFTKTVTETINTGEFLEVTFDEQADLSSPGTEYTIVITSLLTGDENAANDVLTKIVQNTSGVYCYASGSSSTGQEYIANVTIGDISNLSSASQYANYSGDPTLFIYLEPGVASELTITLANPYNADLSAVWIDWNGNGDFYDTGENVYISPMGQGPYVTNITAPDDALHNTNLRMRIRLDYNNPAIDPCGTTSFGEVEDYTVIVSGVQLDPPTNLQYELFEGDINLTWDAPGGKDLPGYNVYYSYNLGNFEVIEYISETSYTFEEPEQGNHRFYITAVYDEGESVASNIVEIVFTGTMENMVDNISIYPNPVLDFATIKFRNSENKVYNLIIRDITGKTVKRKNNITGSKTIIKKGNLKKGIYFIELNGDKIFRSVFIIK